MRDASQDPFRVGIVGAGDIASSAHLPVLRHVPEAQVAWITDADSARARSLAGAVGAKYAPLPEDLHRLPEADVVLLAIPYGARPDYYRVLSGRNVAVLAEKPLFRGVEEHRRTCALFPAHRFGQGLQRRSLGTLRLMRELIGASVFGRLEALRFEMGNPGILTRGRYYSDLELAGGGMLFETGVHGIDALVVMTGARDGRVDEVDMVLEDGFDVHTEAVFTLVAEDTSEVPVSLRVSCLRETANRVDVHFERADVHFSIFDESGRLRAKPRAGGPELDITPGDPKRYPRTACQLLYTHWRAFLTGLREELANYTAASDALLTTQLLEQLYAGGAAAGAPGA